MQETVFCKTCSLHDGNLVRLAEEIRKWMPHASVYVQMNPKRIVVCRCATATVINEGDVFSFIQIVSPTTGNKHHDIVNHSEKRDSVYVSIENNQFFIETYVAKTVGDTENMKFRLTCLFDPDLSMDFDDYASLSNKLNEYLWDEVSTRLMKV